MSQDANCHIIDIRSYELLLVLYKHASLPSSLRNTLRFSSLPWQVALTETDECYPVLSPSRRPCQVRLDSETFMSHFLSRSCCYLVNGHLVSLRCFYAKA